MELAISLSFSTIKNGLKDTCTYKFKMFQNVGAYPTRGYEFKS